MSNERLNVGGSVAHSAVAYEAAPISDPEPLVLDRKAFERTAAVLTPEAVTGYLQTIVVLGQTLLRRLNETDALSHNEDALADAAHTLAGSAGMFGFERLSINGRSFERAARAGSVDRHALANGLVLAIKATHQAIFVALRNDA